MARIDLCELLQSAAGAVGGRDDQLGVLHAGPHVLVISVGGQVCREAERESSPAQAALAAPSEPAPPTFLQLPEEEPAVPTGTELMAEAWEV